MPGRTTALAAVLFFAFAGAASAQSPSSVRVSAGSPPTPFSQNKQNEPSVAVDQHAPTVLAAGANDEIDMEACNAGPDNDCPFTDGVGTSGISFSLNSGKTWTQPNYRGYTARGCLGAPGPDPGCQPVIGQIGTLPNYYEAVWSPTATRRSRSVRSRRPAAGSRTPTARASTTRT